MSLGEPRGNSRGRSQRDTHRRDIPSGVRERCHGGVTGCHPLGDTHRDSHSGCLRGRATGRGPCGNHEECRRETPTGMSRGVSRWEIHVGSHGGSHGESHGERSAEGHPQEEIHGERLRGTDPAGRHAWGIPAARSTKRPGQAPLPPHSRQFPTPRTQKDGRQVKGEPGAGHVPAGKWPLARSNQSHLY